MKRITMMAAAAILLAACGRGDPGPVLYEVRDGAAAPGATAQFP